MPIILSLAVTAFVWKVLHSESFMHELDQNIVLA